MIVLDSQAVACQWLLGVCLEGFPEPPACGAFDVGQDLSMLSCYPQQAVLLPICNRHWLDRSWTPGKSKLRTFNAKLSA
jgi:hypothetical protein